MDGKDKQDPVEKIPASKGKPNRVAKIRKQRMMSKAELARAAGISPLTIDRVERGFSCRMDTKRKIIRALGLDLSQAFTVFPEEGEPPAASAPAPVLPAPTQEAPQLVFPIVEPDTSPLTASPPGAPSPGVALPGGVIPPRAISLGVMPKASPRVAAPSAPKEQRVGEFLTAGNNSSEMQEEATGEGDVPGAS